MSLKKIIGIEKDDNFEINHTSNEILEKKNLILSFLLSSVLLYQLHLVFFHQKYSLMGVFILVDIILYALSRRFRKNSEKNQERETASEKWPFFLPLFLLFVFTLYLFDGFLRSHYGSFLTFNQISILFLLYCFLFFHSAIESFLKKNSKTKLFLVILISIAFGFYLWGGNLKAKWGLIDDHMVMHYFVGNADGVSISEIPKILSQKTEVGNFGHTTINRPFYYFGRVLEAALWQKNVSLWYLGRLFLFIVSVAISWWLLQKIMGVLYGGIFLGFIFLDPYWGWIWGYLGPAESYAMFGCALFFLGFFNIIGKIKKDGDSNKYFIGNSLLLLAGSLIAIGSKENFLFLVLPLAYLVVIIIKRRVKIPAVVISLSLIFAYSLYIFIGIYLGLAKAGGDVYGQEVGFVGRLKLALDNLLMVFQKIGAGWLALSFLLAAIPIKFFTRDEKVFEKYKYLIKNLFVTASILLALFFSQSFFYNGNFPPQSLRYSFPGMLAAPFFVLLLLLTMFSVFKLVGMEKGMIKIQMSLICVTLFAIILVDEYKENRGFVEKNVSATTEFSAEKDKIVGSLKNDPSLAAVFDTTSIWNVEPIASVHAYLLADGIQNPMYLRLNYPAVDRETPGHAIDGKIFDFLSYISSTGECGYVGAEYTFLSGGDCDQWSFSPIKELNSQSSYISVKIDENNKVSSEIVN